MNILYGVQTTGHGHLVRSAAMVQALRKTGHQVLCLLSGARKGSSWDREVFKPYEQRKGLTFSTSQGRIQHMKTALNLDLLGFYRDIREFPAQGFDLAITDYEPLSARIAKRQGFPSIGIGHLYSFCHKVPIHKGCMPGSRLIMTSFAPVDIPLGLHWHHFEQPILPPTIPEDIYPGQPEVPDKILVYLPFEDLEQIQGFLRQFREYRFYVYCKCSAPAQEDNLLLRPISRQGFVQDLADCSGVICNAGFSLSSEALHLGKKLLLKPVAGQIEQKSNALALEQLGLGWSMQKLDAKCTEKWLHLPQPAAQNYPDVISATVSWINSGDWRNPQDLARSLWAQAGSCS
ncbi:MAG: glycosyltransferase family protein [Desulfohalobiaceae bacterium]